MKRPICGLIRVLAALMLMHPAFAQERVAHEADALPLVEVPPQGDSGRVAVFYSGDGGWAALDQGVSARLAAAGVEVIGMNSLKYFWRERTPEEAAADLARIVRKALTGRPPSTKVLLIGYSSGADVMPFMVNRLPQELRLRVATVTLIAPGREAQFVFHVARLAAGAKWGRSAVAAGDRSDWIAAAVFVRRGGHVCAVSAASACTGAHRADRLRPSLERRLRARGRAHPVLRRCPRRAFAGAQLMPLCTIITQTGVLDLRHAGYHVMLCVTLPRNMGHMLQSSRSTRSACDGRRGSEGFQLPTSMRLPSRSCVLAGFPNRTNGSRSTWRGAVLG